MQETNLQKAERLIREINRIHAQYSQDYFETGKVAKVNLSRTLAHVPTGHILSYRLNLHEAINDYLAFADTRGIPSVGRFASFKPVPLFARSERPNFLFLPAVRLIAELCSIFGVEGQRFQGEQGKFVFAQQMVRVVLMRENVGILHFAIGREQFERHQPHIAHLSVNRHTHGVARFFVAGHGVGHFRAVVVGFNLAAHGKFHHHRPHIQRPLGGNTGHHAFARDFHDIRRIAVGGRMFAQLAQAAAALHHHKRMMAAVNPCRARFVVAGREQRQAVVKRGHQAVDVGIALPREIADRQVFHHRAGITGGGSARLRVCARKIRVAAVVFVMAFRVLAQILGVFLRSLLQAGRMCQRLQSGLPAP